MSTALGVDITGLEVVATIGFISHVCMLTENISLLPAGLRDGFGIVGVVPAVRSPYCHLLGSITGVGGVIVVGLTAIYYITKYADTHAAPEAPVAPAAAVPVPTVCCVPPVPPDPPVTVTVNGLLFVVVRIITTHPAHPAHPPPHQSPRFTDHVPWKALPPLPPLPHFASIVRVPESTLAAINTTPPAAHPHPPDPEASLPAEELKSAAHPHPPDPEVPALITPAIV